jgi:hypothetical protein
MQKHSARLKGLGFHELKIIETKFGKDRKKEHPTRGWSKISEFVLDYHDEKKKLTLHPTKGYRLQSI